MIQSNFCQRRCIQHGKEINFICFYKQCQYNRLVCFSCQFFHNKHGKSNLIGVCQLEEKIFELNEKAKNLLTHYQNMLNETHNKVFKLKEKTLSKYTETTNYLHNSLKYIQEQDCQFHPGNKIIMICNKKNCIQQKFLCLECLKKHQIHSSDIIHAEQYILEIKIILEQLDKIKQNLQQIIEKLEMSTQYFNEYIVGQYDISSVMLNQLDIDRFNTYIFQLLLFIDEEDNFTKLFLQSIQEHNLKIEQLQKGFNVDCVFMSNQNKKQSDLLLKQGEKQLKLQNYKNALLLFDQAFELDQSNFLSIYKGNSLRLLKQFQESIVWFDKALLIQPNDTLLLFCKVYSLCQLNNFIDNTLKQVFTFNCYDKVLKIDPKNEFALIGKGDTLKFGFFFKYINDWKIFWFNTPLKLTKNQSLHYQKKVTLQEIQNKTVNHYFGMTRPCQLIKSLFRLWLEKVNRFQKIICHSLQTVLKLQNLCNLKEYQKSLKLYDVALSINQKQVFALIGKGYCLSKLKHYQESIKWYDKAVNIDPSVTFALIAKGDSLKYLKSYQKSLKCYESALKIHPASTYAFSGKGDLLQLLGQFQESLEQYNLALKADQSNLDAIIGYGDSLIQMNKINESITWYNQALHIDPKSISALQRKGDCLRRIQKYNESIKWYDKVLLILLKSQTALWSKGESLRLQKLYQQAIIQYDKVLSIN